MHLADGSSMVRAHQEAAMAEHVQVIEQMFDPGRVSTPRPATSF
jgi:hypothetical protein